MFVSTVTSCGLIAHHTLLPLLISIYLHFNCISSMEFIYMHSLKRSNMAYFSKQHIKYIENVLILHSNYKKCHGDIPFFQNSKKMWEQLSRWLNEPTWPWSASDFPTCFIRLCDLTYSKTPCTFSPFTEPHSLETVAMVTKRMPILNKLGDHHLIA